MSNPNYSFITPDEKRRILDLHAIGLSYYAIAQIVGRHRVSCRRVISRHGASAHPKLTAEQRAEILRIYRKHPVTQRQLAKQFGVSQNTISQTIAAAYKARKERGA